MRRLTVLVLVVVLSLPSFAAVKKSVLMIIAPENFRDEELFVTKGVLEGCGARVVVVSSERGTARGMLGGTYRVEKTYRDVNWENFDAVVLVGGSGAVVFWKDETLKGLLREAYRNGKIVAAICLSPVTLAQAGILKGRKATCWPSVGRMLSKYGAIYTGRDVVVSGRVVTAAGPFAARSFGRAICELLGYR